MPRLPTDTGVLLLQLLQSLCFSPFDLGGREGGRQNESMRTRINIRRGWIKVNCCQLGGLWVVVCFSFGVACLFLIVTEWPLLFFSS